MDKDEILFFLRDCIKGLKVDLTNVPFNQPGKLEKIHKMIKRAKDLVKQYKLLYNYEFTIKTPMRITEGMIKEMTKNLDHYLSGYGAEISSREFLVGDDRKLPPAPEMCKGCKWLKNSECWYNEVYYGTDFPIDCDAYEEED